MARICLELGEVLRSALATPSVEERQACYAQHIVPLVRELETLAKPPLPVRTITPLIHELHWHLRSLSGLVEVNVSSDQKHAVWAQESLDKLSQTVP